MTFPQGNPSVNGYDIGAIDDPVHNGIGNGAVLIRIQIYPDIPDIGLILGVEDSVPLLGATLHAFQQVMGFLMGKDTWSVTRQESEGLPL